MSSSDVTLQEFVAPIPICCQEANLATLIAAIGKNGSESIAIVDRDRFPIGIVRCRRLTAFLLAHKYMTVASNATDIQLNKREFPTIGDLNHLIEPVVNLTAQMKIGEFLLYLQSEPATYVTPQDYTVLDSQGKLLGLVNLPQILNCLNSQPQKRAASASSKIDRGLSLPSNSLNCALRQILERIPLPVALQTTTGENIYQNYHWQNSIDTPNQLDTNSLETSIARTIPHEKSLAESTESYIPATQFTTTAQTQRQQVDWQWRFWRQSNFKNEARLLPNLDPKLHCYCLKGNYYLTSLLTPAQQPVIMNEIPKQLDSIASLASLQHRDGAPSRENFLEGNKPDNWSYIRLPLELDSQQLAAMLAVKNLFTNKNNNSIPSLDKYWLTLAVKPEMFSPSISPANPTSAEALGLEHLKDELLANISHELKSPLTGIVGLSSLLQQQKLGTLNPRQIRYIRSIERSGRQLMNIVNNLLDLSNLAIGQFELNLESIDLKELCDRVYRQVISSLQHSSDLCQQQLKLQTASGANWAIADRWRLSQIMTHLIQNALQFSPPGCPIGIEIEAVRDWIAITVWDRGNGIPQSQQIALLERLLQSNREGIATGLGLILARQLAKAHGGDISFISQVDRGSQFTLLLPDLDPKLNAIDRSLSSEAIRTKAIALIVETQPEIIAALSLKLKQQKVYPIIARTGTEALAKARQFKPNTIFLNPDLPLVSGQTILTLFKVEPQTQGISVLIITKQQEKAIIKQKYPEAQGFICLSTQEPILNSINTEETVVCGTSQLPNLTILCLNLSDRDETTEIDRDFPLKDWVRSIGSTQRHRAIEADNLEQASMLVKIWHIDAIVLNGRVNEKTLNELQSIEEFPALSALPLITLDPEITAIANQISGLSVFPCLVPAQCRNIGNLLQVIQIATSSQ
jgi:signal transduction histidine kinase